MNICKKIIIMVILNFIGTAGVFSQDGLTFKGDSFGFNQRYSANGFFDGKFGYMIGGTANNKPQNDFWRYHLDSNFWQYLDTLPIKSRKGPVCEIIGNKVYYGLGHNGGPFGETDFWEYNLDSNIWRKKASFKGYPGAQSSSFVINNNASHFWVEISISSIISIALPNKSLDNS